MGITNIITLFGGLGLFLFGMKYMGDGLNNVAGQKMKTMLEKLTRNKFKGFLLGVVVTAVIQSSSATTVMVMGFINAGMMDLSQATGVIIGANIGTTVTAILISLKMNFIAPFCIFIGAAMTLFSKKQKPMYTGQIILGFGILFMGLGTMSGAMSGLKESVAFQHFISSANNPLLCFFIGVILCAVLQSSSASVGVLQAMAMASAAIMPMNVAAYLICGINVGSATPLFISAIGAKTKAKRAAFVYFTFDMVGALIFVPFTMACPQYISWIETLSNKGEVRVAIYHIIFKVVTALFLLPFTKYVVKLSEKVLPDKEHESEMRFVYIDKKLNINPTVSVLQAGKEVERMAKLVRDNFVCACEGFISRDTSKERIIRDQEALINWLNHNITDYMVTITSLQLDGESSEYLGKLFHVINDIERIGDHAQNILERTELSVAEDLGYTESGIKEFSKIYEKDLELFDRSIGAFVNKTLPDQEEHQLHFLEDSIDKLTLTAQDNHVERLRHKECHTASGMIFVKLLQDLERVGDHSYNIAWAARKDKDLIRQI